MSIGVLSGTTKDKQQIEIVFECYYQASVNTGSNNLVGTWLAQRYGLSGLNSSPQQPDNFKVLTFDGMQREGAGRWATHEIIGQDRKPVLEFIGPDLESLSFSIILSVFLGVDPLTEIKKLRLLRDTGAICDFVIGGASLSINQWVIKSLSEQHKAYDGSGKLLLATANLSLLEYAKLAKEG